ncbi:MAG TPA: Crp/Fnr family transcriptional regulator [Campylobacterales bacterium]|nr:Crp/Fnr family transcriptional regulator [Campylobacterales bacterium]
MADFEKELLKIEAFRRLESREIELLSAQSQIKSFCEGEMLFYEDEKTPYWYFVCEGKLKAYKTDNTERSVSLYMLEVGMVANDIRALSNDMYEATMFATIEGISKGFLLGVRTSALSLLFAQIPKFQLISLQAALSSVERYQRAFYSGMILDGAGKVAFMIANDLDRFNSMKKQDIAASLNIQPETLSRIIGKLARKGVIEAKSDIKIIDISGLREFYE